MLIFEHKILDYDYSGSTNSGGYLDQYNRC